MSQTNILYNSQLGWTISICLCYRWQHLEFCLLEDSYVYEIDRHPFVLHVLCQLALSVLLPAILYL